MRRRRRASSVSEQQPKIDRYDKEGDYEHRGKKGPGVTRVLSELFAIYGIETDIDFWKERGTIVHAATVQIEEDRISWRAIRDLYPHTEGFLRGYERFLAETGWKSTLREKRVFSNKYMFGATRDRFGKFGHHMRKRWAVLEIKTGDGAINKAVAYQLAGQLLALKEDSPQLVRGKHVNRASVQLRSNGKYDLRWWDAPADLSRFLAMNLTWQVLKEFKKIKE